MIEDDTFYIILSSNAIMLLFIFLVIRPMYEMHVIKKIKTSMLKSVTAALENTHASFNSKLAYEIEKVKTDIREEAAIGRIVNCTLIQKKGREDE